MKDITFNELSSLHDNLCKSHQSLIEQYHAQTAPYFAQINAIYRYRQFFHLTDQEQSAVNALHSSIQLISDQLFNANKTTWISSHTSPTANCDLVIESSPIPK